jgi:hypothetical protein
MRPLLLLCAFSLAMPVYGEGTFLSFTKFPPAKVKGEGEFAYARYIVGTHQKSLFDYPPDVDVYRFVVDYAFEPGALVIITRRGDEAEFHSFQCIGPPGDGVSGIACDFNRPLSKPEWSAFKHLLNESRFWEKTSYVSRDGNDGWDYVLEARVGGHYHYVMRWVPEDYPEDKAFGQLCTWLNERIKKVGTVTTETGHAVTASKGVPIILGK